MYYNTTDSNIQAENLFLQNLVYALATQTDFLSQSQLVGKRQIYRRLAIALKR